jgi:hypothetical protein
MFEYTDSVFTVPEIPPYAKLARKLAEAFVVRDVMVHLPQIEYVTPGDKPSANRIVQEKRYSVVPVSKDGETFTSVFCTDREPLSARRITEERQTSISDYIPEITPLIAGFSLFRDREWYFTLRNNQVSGLVTYWMFNSREFGLLLYAGLSRVEELSRNVLAKDGCGVVDEKGLNLTQDNIEKIKKRIKPTWIENGGNRFVDELDYHQINTSLKKHLPWRAFLKKNIGEPTSNSEYDRFYNFTDLRDAVMHGRVVFPTYQRLRENLSRIQRIDHLVARLDEYLHA